MHSIKKNVLFLFLSLVLLSCSKTDVDPGANTTNPNNGTGSNPVSNSRDINLPENLQTNGCLISDFSFDLSSIGGGLTQGFKYNYDNLKRLKSVELISINGNKPTSTYTYSPGKVSVVFDKPLLATQGFKGTAEIILDNKNRFSKSQINVIFYSGATEFKSDISINYKYDANGYLIEDITETKESGVVKALNTTKYTWENGNLIKSEIKYGYTNNDVETAITYYNYDLDKVNGTWDGGTAANSSAYYFLQGGYAGKSNKNLLTSINQENRTANKALNIDYLLKVKTSYIYSFNSKGFPSTLTGKTETENFGSFPFGITIPNTVATFKATLNYNC